MSSDSSTPGFWDTRFRDGVTPWDAGGAPPRLVLWLEGKPPCRVLVPGCGTGYEAKLFKRMAELVRPGGALAGFFYRDDNERGPPFGASPDTLAQLRGEALDLEVSEPVPAGQSLPVFKGKEIWQVWKRRL